MVPALPHLLVLFLALLLRAEGLLMLSVIVLCWAPSCEMALLVPLQRFPLSCPAAPSPAWCIASLLLESSALETGCLGCSPQWFTSISPPPCAEFLRLHSCLQYLCLEFPRALVLMYGLALHLLNIGGLASDCVLRSLSVLT